MFSLQYSILRIIQKKPISRSDITKRINRFRVKKIPAYFIERAIDGLEENNYIEEISAEEEQKILAGEDPDDIEIVSSDEFIGKYTLAGIASLLLLQEHSENRRLLYAPLYVSALSTAISLIALFLR